MLPSMTEPQQFSPSQSSELVPRSIGSQDDPAILRIPAEPGDEVVKRGYYVLDQFFPIAIERHE